MIVRHVVGEMNENGVQSCKRCAKTTADAQKGQTGLIEGDVYEDRSGWIYAARAVIDDVKRNAKDCPWRVH